jgi:hypothetical protein
MVPFCQAARLRIVRDRQDERAMLGMGLRAQGCEERDEVWLEGESGSVIRWSLVGL